MAFGTVETWSYLVMGLLVCASALLLCLDPETKTFYRVPGLLPLIIVNLFVLFQIIPLPGSFVKLLSPSTYALYQNLADFTGKTGWISFSIFPHATLTELLRFSIYVLFYFTAVQLLSDRIYLKITIAVIAGFAAVLSLITIIEFVTESMKYSFPHNKIFWIRELSQGGTPVGPYVNRNHYAGLMEMIFPLTLSMFLAYRPMIVKLSLKRRILNFFNQKRVNQHFFYGTAAILIGTSILLSLSRGGIISLALSMILFSTILYFKANQKKAGLYIAVIVVFVLFWTGTSGWDAIFNRFENLRNQSGLIYDNRLIIWKDSIDIIRNFPLFGTGTGTFEKIYPLYRTFPGNDILEHAHNDYLEFLSTGGIILPALMGWALFSILNSAFISFVKRREWYSMLLFVGCVTSVCAILFHSLVDFNMQIGANGLYFFLILGIAVSAANTRMRYGLDATYLKKSNIPSYYKCITVAILLLAVSYMYGGGLAADGLFSKHRKKPIIPDISKEKRIAIHQAARISGKLDPLNSIYPNIAAKTLSMPPNRSDALHYHSRSLRLEPLNSRHLMDTASFLQQQGTHDLAAALFGKSILYDKKNMAAYIKYAAMLLETQNTEKSFQIMKQAISVDTRITDTCLALMALHQINDDQFHLALPERVAPHLTLGEYFESLGDIQKAQDAYVHALDFISNEPEIEKHLFLHVYRFYLRNEQTEKALQVILKAITFFPDDSGLYRTAGNLYKILGITHRAQEAYRKADILK